MDKQELVYWMPEKNIRRELDRAERALRKIPPESMHMAWALLFENRQYLMDQLPRIRRRMRFARRLPKGEKDARILEAARSICWEDDAELRPDRLVKALHSMQPEGGWTLGEMEFLPLSLRAALLEKSAKAAARCREDALLQRKAAGLIARLQKDSRHALPRDRDLLEAMWLQALEQERGEVLASVRRAFAAQAWSPEQASRHRESRQTQLMCTLRRTLMQLQALDNMDVRAAAEQVLPVFRVLGEHAVFRQMDRDSRWFYALQAARIGKEYGVSETDCARAACVLAAEAGSDVGEYLIRCPERIGAYLGAGRVRFDADDRRLQGLALLPGAVLLGFLLILDVHPLMAVPACVCASAWTGRLLLNSVRALRPGRMLPRLRRATDCPTVTAVYACVQCRRQLLRQCRKLLTLEALCGREDMDFLLLGYAPWAEGEENGRTLELTEEAEKTFAAMNGRAGREKFHFALLERKQMHKQDQDGICLAANWLCGLIAAGEGAEKVRFATLKAPVWQGRYRYVMLLDEHTMMPPGEGDKLLRTMAHPLFRDSRALIFPVLRRSASHHPGRLESFLGGTVLPDAGVFQGVGLLDAALWHEQVKVQNCLLAGAQARGVCAQDCVFACQSPLTLRAWFDGVWHRGFRWALALWSKDRKSLTPAHRWMGAGLFALPWLRWLVLLLAAWGHAPWLALFALPAGGKEAWIEFLLLPGAALMRTLGALGMGRKMPAEFSQPAASLLGLLASGTAVLTGALGANGSQMLCAVGVVWVMSPLLGLWADAPRLPRPRFSAGQTRALREDARKVWDYFADLAGEEQGFLPTEWIQHWPDDRVSPSCSLMGAAFYLLAVVCAREMGLIAGEEMSRRLCLAVDTLENIPWRDGLPCARWESGSLSVLEGPRTMDAGIWGVCLLCAAQAVRIHLGDGVWADGQTAARMDALFDRMDFIPLYDRKKGQFFTDPTKKNGHVEMLNGGGALLAFAAVVKGQVPLSHLLHLGRGAVRAGGGVALLAHHGSLSDYLFPALLMPLSPDTLLPSGVRNALRVQLTESGVWPWGQSDGYGEKADAAWAYCFVRRGMAQLAVQPPQQRRGAACYVSYLALPYVPRAAVRNIRKWKKLGAEGLYGLYDGADFGHGRPDSATRCIRMYDSVHQAWTLCALYEALEGKKIGSYLRGIPRAESGLMLLEMPVPRHVPMRPAVRRPKPLPSAKYRMDRSADRERADGFAVGFQGSYWVMNGQGTGELVLNGYRIWHTQPAWDWDGGFRLYVRAGEQAVRPAKGQTRMRTGEIIFSSFADALEIREKRTISPLNGLAVVEVRIINRGCRAAEADVTAYCPLLNDEWNSVHPADPRTLVLSGEQGYAAMKAAGNAADLQWAVDSRAFFGMGDDERPDFVMGKYASGPEQKISCMAWRMALAVPPMGETVCAFVLGAARKEETLRAMLTGAGSLRWVRETGLLARGTAVQQARQLDLDERRQRLYGRLLGAVWFAMQPHQCGLSVPEAPGPETRPLLTLIPEGQGAQMLLRHGLLFYRSLRRMGIGLRLCILCPREAGGQMPLRDGALQMMERMGLSGDESVRVLCLNKAEERAVLPESRLVLRGGETLEEQLDQLTCLNPGSMRPAQISLPVPFVTESTFTEDGVRLVTGTGAVRHVLSGEKVHLLLSDRGLLGMYCPGGANAPLTRGTGAGADGDAAERILLCREERNVDILRGGVSLDMGGAVYECEAEDCVCRIEVAVHPHEALSVRRVTLRARTPFRGTLRWNVRFCMDEGEQFTRLVKRGKVLLALGSGRMDAAFACMTGAAYETEICCAPHGYLLCPLELKARESVTLTLSAGSIRDALAALPEAADDGKRVLNTAREQAQRWLSALRIYTMHAHTDRMVNFFLPLQARTALREAAGDGKARLLCALGLLLHDETLVQQTLASIRPEETDACTRCVWVYVCSRYLEHTGTTDIWRAEDCFALLMQQERLTEQEETMQENTLLWRLMALSALLPLLQGKPAAEAERECLHLRRQAQAMWTDEAEARSFDLCCLAVCAGVRGRCLRTVMERMATEGITTQQHGIWALWALCGMDEGARGWELLQWLLTENSVMENPFRMKDGCMAGLLLHVVLSVLLGVRRQKDEMAFDPARGAGEEDITLVYRFGRAHYYLTADVRTAMVMLDGKRLQGGTVPLQADDGTHEGRFPLRKE